MSTNTTNMSMGKAVDGDNARTYLETTLASALDKIDAHDHSGTTHGLGTFGGGLTISASGLTVLSGGVGIGTVPASSAALNIVTPGDTYGLVISGTHSGNQIALAGIALLATIPVTVSSNYDAIQTQPKTDTGAHIPGVTGVHIYAPLNGAGGASINTVFGLQIDSMNSGAGNNYGIWVGQPVAGSDDNFAIYVQGGGVVISGPAPIRTPAGAVAWSGDVMQGNGSAATGPAIKGSANGPSTVAGAGWIQLNTNSTPIWIPYWV